MKAFSVICLCLLVACFSASPLVRATNELPPETAEFVAKYCVSCHGPEEQKGDFRIDTLGLAQNGADAALWELVLDSLYSGEMPPEKASKRPEFKEVEPVTVWIQSELQRARRVLQGQTGEVVLRRLNRNEYVNTIADLFDVHGPFAEAFPEDATSHGFDMIGSALMLSAAQLDEYTRAANYILDQVLKIEAEPPTQRIESSLHRINLRSWSHAESDLKKRLEQFDTLTEPEQTRTRQMQAELEKNPNRGFTLYAWENGRLREPLREETHTDLAIIQQSYSSNNLDTQLFFRVSKPGWYRYILNAYSARNNGQPVRLQVELASGWGASSDHSSVVDTFHVQPGEPQVLEVKVHMMPNDTLRLRMLDGPSWIGPNINPIETDTPLIAVRSDVMEGPVYDDWPPKGYRTLFGTKDAKDPSPENVRNIIQHFGGTLFRRPLKPDATDRFLAFYQKQVDELGHEDALRNTFVAMMVSPRFLYQLEPPKQLDAYAVASRLSYFLWRSTPDAELMAKAASGELLKPEQLTAQTDRLIHDERSQRFVHDFTGQWLRVKEVGKMRADPNLYPEYDDELELAIAAETRGFIAELFKDDLPVHHLIDSDWTILNERLAKHYGIPGVKGPEFRKVRLDKTQTVRGGLLTQASMHAVTSDGSNTSPIHRGIWVLENLLGTPPPPPPPDVPAIEPDIRGATSILDQLEKHRNTPACASCHSRIDPLGIALENFDVIGGWRENYRGLETAPGKRAQIIEGVPVSPAAQLHGAGAFSSFAEFRTLMMKRRETVATNVAQKLATFALGRELDFSDRDEINAIVQDVNQKEGGFRSMVQALIQSPLFRKP